MLKIKTWFGEKLMLLIVNYSFSPNPDQFYIVIHSFFSQFQSLTIVDLLIVLLYALRIKIKILNHYNWCKHWFKKLELIWLDLKTTETLSETFDYDVWKINCSLYFFLVACISLQTQMDHFIRQQWHCRTLFFYPEHILGSMVW